MAGGSVLPLSSPLKNTNQQLQALYIENFNKIILYAVCSREQKDFFNGLLGCLELVDFSIKSKACENVYRRHIFDILRIKF